MERQYLVTLIEDDLDIKEENIEESILEAIQMKLGIDETEIFVERF